MPDFIKKRKAELEELCEKYPIEIPLIEVAKFLHIHPDSLRLSIIQGTCGFSALAWRKLGTERNSFSIQTLPFYLAYTGQKGVIYGED
jgi:hypothetical protein